MNNFLAPAVALMARLRFRSKFVLCGGITALLVLGLGVLQIERLGERVRSIEAERSAVALAGTLVEWNQALIEHRRIAISAGADVAAVRQRLQQQAQVLDQLLARIGQQVAAARTLYDTGRDVEGLRQGWQQLQKTVQALPADLEFTAKAFAAHGPEFERLYAFLRDLGNRSRMALDPDLDLFSLGYPLANHSPGSAGVVVRLYAYAAMNLPRGEITPKDKAYYEVTQARLDDGLASVDTLLKQAMDSNPALQPRLAPAFDKFKGSAKELQVFIRGNFIEASGVQVTQQQLDAEALPAIAAAWEFVQANRVVMDTLLQERAQRAVLARNALAALLAGALLATLYLSMGMYAALERGILQAADGARALARGELGRVPRPSSKDELGELLAELGQADASLAAMVARVRGAAGSMREATEEIAAGNTDLSQRTEEQASTLEETAASVEQLTGTVRQNAQSAREADQLARSASETAERGGTVVDEVVATMASINTASRRIVDIIAVIDGIAFQTNILALNAAVEAARAGEQGRGFAVVAAEVRTLAQRCASAAREIKGLIQDSVDRVDAGSALVSRAGNTMKDVVAGIQRVTTLMGAIATASGEQTVGIEQVNQALVQMDRVTQQNAALVEQASAAAQSMREQAVALAAAVDQFKLEGDDEALQAIELARTSSRGALRPDGAALPRPVPDAQQPQPA